MKINISLVAETNNELDKALVLARKLSELSNVNSVQLSIIKTDKEVKDETVPKSCISHFPTVG